MRFEQFIKILWKQDLEVREETKEESPSGFICMRHPFALHVHILQQGKQSSRKEQMTFLRFTQKVFSKVFSLLKMSMRLSSVIINSFLVILISESMVTLRRSMHRLRKWNPFQGNRFRIWLAYWVPKTNFISFDQRHKHLTRLQPTPNNRSNFYQLTSLTNKLENIHFKSQEIHLGATEYCIALTKIQISWIVWNIPISKL